MLVLRRRLGEEIVIEDGRIVVKVVEINGNQVLLGFETTDDVVIHRREIHELIKEQKEKQNATG